MAPVEHSFRNLLDWGCGSNQIKSFIYTCCIKTKRETSLRGSDLLLQRQMRYRFDQYLNCKILHGGTLLQPLPNAFGMQKYFGGYYFFPYPKSSKDQKKKDLHQKFNSFRPRNQVKTKTKKGLQRHLGLHLAGICGIYLCCQALFRLFNQHSNFDGGTLPLTEGTRSSASPLQFKC